MSVKIPFSMANVRGLSIESCKATIGIFNKTCVPQSFLPVEIPMGP